MISAQPGKLVATVVFEDLDRTAVGYPTGKGAFTVHADLRVLENDPLARAAAFDALVKQATAQAADAPETEDNDEGDKPENEG